jgi:hypothetical protein
VSNRPRIACGECPQGKAPHVFQEEAWKAQVFDRAEEVDPGSEYGWFELCLGWAIGRGMTPAEAHAFATHVRYHTELG